MSDEQTARKITEILARLDQLEALSSLNYNKGTYTPTYLGSATPGVTTYSGTPQGSWVRIGKVVIVTGTIVWTSATGTGNAQISLPFTAVNVADQNFAVALRTASVTFANGTPQGQIAANQAFFTMQSPLSNNASATVQMEAAGNVIFTAVYFVA